MTKITPYAKRRQHLLDTMDAHSIAIIPAAPLQQRNGDINYRYRQNSDFHYLTNFPEPEAVAILSPGEKRGEFILFNRSYDEQKALWEGTCIGQENACSQYGADAAYPITTLAEELPKLLQGKQHIYYPIGSHLSPRLLRIFQETQISAKKSPYIFKQLSQLTHPMRLIKDDFEIEQLREAVAITVKGHKHAMRACKQLEHEYQLEAELTHEFLQHGCRHQAYDPIVAAGNNSCTLHYTNNCDHLPPGELVLIDAGCEYHLYAADITRTFPINGRFSVAQKALYEVVLQAQLAGIAAILPNNTLEDVQQAVVQHISEGLLALGILDGSLDDIIENKLYRQFYPHSPSHWLGLDVHDVGRYKIDDAWRPLQPGMVFTIEPGVYIPENTSDVDEKWYGIGIRIEDDILVTHNGHEVLSSDLPKTVADIEAWINQDHS